MYVDQSVNHFVYPPVAASSMLTSSNHNAALNSNISAAASAAANDFSSAQQHSQQLNLEQNKRPKLQHNMPQNLELSQEQTLTNDAGSNSGSVRGSFDEVDNCSSSAATTLLPSPNSSTHSNASFISGELRDLTNLHTVAYNYMNVISHESVHMNIILEASRDMAAEFNQKLEPGP